MGRRGHSTAIGKFAKVHHARRLSEIRRLGVALRDEQDADNQTKDLKAASSPPAPQEV